MHEQSKLNEAMYFYSRMLSDTDNREHLLFDLSAFLSAARSVLQYALEEARSKSGGQQWYDSRVSASAVLTFFKDKRDINVHTEPIQVNQHASLQLTEVVRISESIHIKKFDQTGKLIGEHSSEPGPQLPAPDVPTVLSHRFTFADWNGNEDVFQQCNLYLTELERIAADGQNKGFLTR